MMGQYRPTRLLYNPQGDIRPVWKAAAFLLLVVLAVGLAGPLSGLLLGLWPASGNETLIFPTVFALLILFVTVLCLRLEGQRLTTLGLAPTRKRLVEFTAGVLVGALLFAGLAFMQSARVGATWTWNPAFTLSGLLVGLGMVFLSVWVEELLFRGYGFARLAHAIGPWPTLLATALAFGLWHIVQWDAAGRDGVFMVISAALGSLVFGVAFFRTGGMALPIGIHLGGNWMQANVLHLATEAGDASLWIARLSPEQATALFAPQLPAKLPYLVMMTLVLAGLLWWRREETLQRRLMRV